MSKNSLFRPLFSLIILLLVILPFFSSLTILSVKANPMPSAYTQMTVYPENNTFNKNSAKIRFTVETNTWLNFYYSQDGKNLQQKKI